MTYIEHLFIIVWTAFLFSLLLFFLHLVSCEDYLYTASTVQVGANLYIFLERVKGQVGWTPEKSLVYK